MKITVLHKQIQATQADALLIPIFESAAALEGVAGAIDTALGAKDGVPGDGAISKLIGMGDFKGKIGELAVLYTDGLIPAPRVVLVGLGKGVDFTQDRARQSAGAAARKARDLGCKRIAVAVPGAGATGPDARKSAQATVEGLILGAFQFREHKVRADSGRALEEVLVVESDASILPLVNAGAHDGEIIADAVNFARRLIGRAPNVLSPKVMAEQTAEMAKQTGLRCEVLTETEIGALNMGGVLAVSQGSLNPPRFVVLEHAPEGADVAGNDAPLVLVGKGVTFDTGGISLKDPGGMEAMKGDMGGAAAVIGAMQAIAGLGVKRRVIGLVPMVENMPSDRAFRPSDVITMMSGLTVEIISTDAEGRMILADALHYAKRFKPAGVVDLATLTGACVIALGDAVAAGLFANTDEWSQRVLGAAGAAGEKLWRLPLYPEYGERIRSDYAEIKNSGGRMGGVGTSAYFLKRFVEDDGVDQYPWAHIDMASMSFSPDTKGHNPKGPMGYGVRTLVELAQAAD